MKKIMERIKEESFFFYKGGILINHDFFIILLGLPYTFNIINYKSIFLFQTTTSGCQQFNKTRCGHIYRHCCLSNISTHFN